MKTTLKISLLLILLIIAVFLAISKGSVNIPLSELFLKENQQVLHLRILRILAATIAGSGLAVSGIALQAILRNPLAEPYLLGTSSGAGLGAVTAMLLGAASVYLPLAALIGAILSTILVYNLAKQGAKIPTQSLILSGVIVSIALSGITVFLISVSPNEALHGIMWWLWGSLQVYDLKLLFAAGIIVALGIFVIFIFSQDLNAISIGDEEAMHLGINTETIKKVLFFITSLITAGIVSICGVIGFVGLIIPHLARLLFGPNHRILIPATFVLATVFMVLCDIFSRALFSPLEIPIGIITAFLGAPVFIILLKIKQAVK